MLYFFVLHKLCESLVRDCVKFAPNFFDPAKIFLGTVSTQFGLVGLATFNFWAIRIKEIGVFNRRIKAN